MNDYISSSYQVLGSGLDVLYAASDYILTSLQVGCIMLISQMKKL